MKNKIYNMNYEKILNDVIIIKEYQKIDEDNNYYMSHGLKHIKNVIKICEKLSKTLSLSKNETNILLIAASLHDIGASTGRDNHANKSANFCRNYLSGKMDEKEIDMVYKIINRHSWESEKENILEVLLSFADKMDFTKDRLEDNYQLKYEFKSLLDNILIINFELDDEYFIVKIVTDGNLTIEKLCEEKKKYDQGIKLNTEILAKWLNKKYKVFFDDKEIFNG